MLSKRTATSLDKWEQTLRAKMRKTKRHISPLIFVSAWFSIQCPTRCNEYNCISYIPGLVVNETSPVGTEILRMRLNKSVTLELELVTNRMEAIFIPIYRQAFVLEPTYDNNTMKCKYDAATRDANGSLCRIITVKSLDGDRALNQPGSSPVDSTSFTGHAVVITFKLKCMFPIVGRSFYREIFLSIELQNEFPPRFHQDPISLKLSLFQLEAGYQLLDMSGRATDADVGNDGHINYCEGNRSDLIKMVKSKVLLKKNVTAEDLEGLATKVRFLFIKMCAVDQGNPRRRSCTTLILEVCCFEYEKIVNIERNDTSITTTATTINANTTTRNRLLTPNSTAKATLILFGLATIVVLGLAATVGAIVSVLFFLKRRRKGGNEDFSDMPAQPVANRGVVPDNFSSESGVGPMIIHAGEMPELSSTFPETEVEYSVNTPNIASA